MYLQYLVPSQYKCQEDSSLAQNNITEQKEFQ